MDFLPKTLGTRPRLAMEIRPEGIVAGRAEDATAQLTAVARADVAEGMVTPSLRASNIVDKSQVVAAARKALDAVAERGGGGRLRDVTVIVPDSAARVLFLDFDQLPSKAAEALPVVRFRLKKLLPFDADDAVVSYQMMASEKGAVKLLVVAMPKTLLQEYEGIALGAGYLPGAVLPSTLAALGGLEESEAASLVVNAGRGVVTTAIVRAGALLLHRSLDVTAEGSAGTASTLVALPLIDRESTAGEWARQDALGPGGWDGMDAQTAIESGVTVMAVAHAAERQAAAHEVIQAISVAAAYYEDILQTAPAELLVAGALGGDRLTAMMEESGLEGLRVREMVDSGMLDASAATASVPRSWLAGVRGALRN